MIKWQRLSRIWKWFDALDIDNLRLMNILKVADFILLYMPRIILDSGGFFFL